MRGDARRTWSAVKTLLHGEGRSQSVSTQGDASFCTTLAGFFINKVRNIENSLQDALDGLRPMPLSSDQPHQGPLLSEFTPILPSEVHKLLATMPAKSSPLDVVPTSLLKACPITFSNILAFLTNLSINQGCFPTQFKKAQITPLMKKPCLDPDDPASYRPISNLNTISKIIERLVLTRIIAHVSSSPSVDCLQSAYRRFHSTETALLKVTDDIYKAFNDGQSLLLVALDMSAAFDCINHGTLLNRLQHTFGVSGKAFDWFRSYLHRRTAFVKFNSSSSSCNDLAAGVPQGSSLGPVLFSLYIAPLAELIKSLGVHYHQYADDTQLYIAISKNNKDTELETLQQCTSGVQQWLMHNGLLLNPAKSDAVQFTLGKGRSAIEEISKVCVSGVAIKPSMFVKSLGVTLDKHLSFNEQVDNVCKSAYFHIRALRHIRESLPDDVAKTVACSIVSSRLDYCNALYYNLSTVNLAKLQRVQNTLARVVLRQRKYDHITPALTHLHWLPIKHRVIFKLATLTFKTLQSHQPRYLYDLIASEHQPVRSLRSSAQNRLNVNISRTVTSSRSFRHSSVAVWNNLPQNIRDSNCLTTFRSKLKTHLFSANLAI